VYCARCNKSIRDERLEELKRSLREIGNENLMHGRCPVCGTVLVSNGGKNVTAESGRKSI
jgi:uncharacterized protein with PIN domain